MDLIMTAYVISPWNSKEISHIISLIALLPTVKIYHTKQQLHINYGILIFGEILVRMRCLISSSQGILVPTFQR